MRSYRCLSGDIGSPTIIDSSSSKEAAIEYCHRRDRQLINGDSWMVTVIDEDGIKTLWGVGAHVSFTATELISTQEPTP